MLGEITKFNLPRGNNQKERQANRAVMRKLRSSAAMMKVSSLNAQAFPEIRHASFRRNSDK